MNRVSVKDFGAVGDGVTDDRVAIQNAIDSGKPLLFPNGVYLLDSYSTKDSGSILLCDGKYNKIDWKFETGGTLLVKETIPDSIYKIAVVNIRPKISTIESAVIDGIHIKSSLNTLTEITGIRTSHYNEYDVRNFKCTNALITDTTEDGLHIQSNNNYLYNITCINNNGHALGIITYKDTPIPNTVSINGFTSINCDAYSIDFSGGKNDGALTPNGQWVGTVKNVLSINTRYGVKIAGHWKLSIEDMTILKSKYNGFFINVDSKDYGELVMDRVFIKDCGRSGFSGDGEFNKISLNNLTVSDTKAGSLKAHSKELTLTNIKLINGNHGVLISGNAKIDNLMIENHVGDTIFRTYCDNLYCKNLFLIKAGSGYSILSYDNPSVNSIEFDTITFANCNPITHGIYNANQSKIKVSNTDFTELTGQAVNNQSLFEFKNCIGI